MPGPARKPAGERQRRNHYPTLGTPAVPAVVPPAPHGLRPSLERAWLEYWATPMAGLVVASDLPALRRLFEQRERAAHAQELFIDTGEAGFGRLATAIDAEIRQMEDRFGLTPSARLKFVSEMDNAQRAEASMRDRAEDEEYDPSADPRLTDTVPAASHPRPSGRGMDEAEPGARRGRPRG